MATLTQRLAALAPALAAAITAAPGWDCPALQQARAGSIATSACSFIGLRLDVKGSDALRLAAAAKLLILAGRAALPRVAAAVERNPGAKRNQQALISLLTMQLYAMDGCMALIEGCERPEAISVFASTTAPAGTLPPWLAATADALLLALRTCRQGATS